MHTSNLYGIPNQEKLADKLCKLSAMDKVFFCNSGAEANEAAIKIARRYGHNRGIALPTIIVANKSFHNLSLICQMTSEDIKHQLIIIIHLRGAGIAQWLEHRTRD